MDQQARIITGWGSNVYVKVPVQTTQGLSTVGLVKDLSRAGIKLNVTALFTTEQVAAVVDALEPSVPAVISVFAGRMADVGVDPIPVMEQCRKLTADKPKTELLWAATREVFNIIEADRLGCQIITVPNDILGKLKNLGRSVQDACNDTVVGFYQDAQTAGFTIE
jgi:transaldolase